MASRRRGGAVAAARTPADSSAGRARVMPAARRNARRENGRSVMSLAPEGWTLNDSVDQRAEPVTLLAHVGDDLLDDGSVGEFQPMPGPVDQELAGQVAGELVGVFEHQLFEA